MQNLSPEELGREMTGVVHETTISLSQALGARLGKPRDPPIAKDVETVARYAQEGGFSDVDVAGAANRIMDVLSITSHPEATNVARAIFDRLAGEPTSKIEIALLAARARLCIELNLEVPIRWLAVLAGISVKTARNLASDRVLQAAERVFELANRETRSGQVATAREASRWLATRGITTKVGSRIVRARRG